MGLSIAEALPVPHCVSSRNRLDVQGMEIVNETGGLVQAQRCKEAEEVAIGYRYRSYATRAHKSMESFTCSQPRIAYSHQLGRCA